MSYESSREPELYWTDMSDAAWQAQNAPWSAAWVATLARNTECHKLAMYGTGDFTDDVGHAHQGGQSAHLSPCSAPNLLMSACPSLSVGELRGSGGPEYIWLASGWDISTRVVGFAGGAATFGEDSRAVIGGVTGGWLSQRLFALPGGAQSRMLGRGCDVVASCYVRSTGPLDRGAIQFGISGEDMSGRTIDPSASVSLEGPGDFGPFSSGVIHHTDLSTSWQRFYVRVTDAGKGLRGDIRLSLSTARSFNEQIEASGFMVTQGRRLYPWAPGPGDVPQGNTAWGHTGWFNMPDDVPLFDWAIGITNAVELATV